MWTLLLLAGCGAAPTEGQPGCDGAPRFRDADGDGHGAGEPELRCGAGWSLDDLDCDDRDAAVFPGAPETCDTLDQDCDGDVDEPGATGERTWYADADGDGWGGDDARVACWPPAGHVGASGDCDDDDDATWPGAPEPDCGDAADRNCDGSAGHVDADGDGAPACDDCDDRRADRGPQAMETCDGVDEDCDGEIDEIEALNARPWYPDADGDGWGVGDAPTWSCTGGPRLAAAKGDCDDQDPAVGEGCDADVEPGCAGGEGCGAAAELDLGDAAASWFGPGPGAAFGGAVAAVDDLDGDGVSELAVSVMGIDGGEGGGTLVYASTRPSTPWAVLRGEPGVRFTEERLARLGDLDGDGVSELAVSAPKALDDAGAIYVVSGAALRGDVDLVRHGVRDGGAIGDDLGQAMVGPGDLTGDGTADLVACAKHWSGVGAVFVFDGPVKGRTDTTEAWATVHGMGADDRAGASVAGADLDGDGVADLVVGASSVDRLAGTAGAAYVLYGPIAGDVPLDAADAVVYGLARGGMLGKAVATGDFDGDGLPDLAVGAPHEGDAYGGGVYLFAGPQVGTVTPRRATASFHGEPDEGAGAVLALTDLDADGLADVVLRGDVRAARDGVRVFSAPLQGALAGGTSVLGDGTDGVGLALAPAGDTDGDGLGDLWLGAPGYGVGVVDQGAAFLFLGGSGR